MKLHARNLVVAIILLVIFVAVTVGQVAAQTPSGILCSTTSIPCSLGLYPLPFTCNSYEQVTFGGSIVESNLSGVVLDFRFIQQGTGGSYGYATNDFADLYKQFYSDSAVQFELDPTQVAGAGALQGSEPYLVVQVIDTGATTLQPNGLPGSVSSNFTPTVVMTENFENSDNFDLYGCPTGPSPSYTTVTSGTSTYTVATWTTTTTSSSFTQTQITTTSTSTTSTSTTTSVISASTSITSTFSTETSTTSTATFVNGNVTKQDAFLGGISIASALIILAAAFIIHLLRKKSGGGKKSRSIIHPRSRGHQIYG